MKTSMGFWDSIFGERLNFKLPMRDGTTRNVRVTRSWLDAMVKQRRMTEIKRTVVQVNVLGATPELPADCRDPELLMNAILADVSAVKVEEWQLGVQVTDEQYKKFVDPQTRQLYAVRKQDSSGVKTLLVQRTLWDQTRAAMRDV